MVERTFPDGLRFTPRATVDVPSALTFSPRLSQILKVPDCEAPFKAFGRPLDVKVTELLIRLITSLLRMVTWLPSAPGRSPRRLPRPVHRAGVTDPTRSELFAASNPLPAAAGGVGLLLVQMAKMRGARVIGTVSTAEKEQLARGAGADEVINYSEVSVKDAVKELTGGKGVGMTISGQIAGRKIADGRTDLTLRYRIDDGELDGEEIVDPAQVLAPQGEPALPVAARLPVERGDTLPQPEPAPDPRPARTDVASAPGYRPGERPGRVPPATASWAPGCD